MRNYTKVGTMYLKEEIDKAIKRTDWREFKTNELPFMQGECIKVVISQCNIPLKGISRMDLHNNISHNGENHGFYALDVKYKNGQAQIYIVDSGAISCVVATDFLTN